MDSSPIVKVAKAIKCEVGQHIGKGAKKCIQTMVGNIIGNNHF